MVNENIKTEDYRTLLVALIIFIFSLGIILLKYYNPITGFAALGINTNPKEIKSAISAYSFGVERMVDSTTTEIKNISVQYIESILGKIDTSSQYLPFFLLFIALSIGIYYFYLVHSGIYFKLVQLVKTLKDLFLVSLKLGVSNLTIEKKAAKKNLKVQAKTQTDVHALKDFLHIIYLGFKVIKQGIKNILIFLLDSAHRILAHRTRIIIHTPTSTLSRGVFHQIKSSLHDLVGFVSASFLFISSRAVNLATTLNSSVAIFLSEIFSAPIKLLSNIKINNEVLAEPDMGEMEDIEPREMSTKKRSRLIQSEPSEMDRLIMLAQRLESQIQSNLHEDINLQSARPSMTESMSIALPKQITAFTRKRAVHKIHKEIEQKTNELSSYMNELDHELNNNLHSKIKWQKERPDELTKKEIVETKKSLFEFFRR